MKKFKKDIICILSMLTLGCCLSSMSVCAYTEENMFAHEFIDSENNTIWQDALQNATINMNDENIEVFAMVDGVPTVLFVDGTEYVFPVGTGEPITNSDEKLAGYGVYLTPNDDDYIILPSGNSIKKGVNSEVIAIFTLDGTYIGYRAFIGEEGYGHIFEYADKMTTAEYNAIKDNLVIGESSTPSEETLQRGDINGDGKINVLDLLQLKKYILKIVDTLD